MLGAQGQVIDWLRPLRSIFFSRSNRFRFTWAQELAIFMIVWMAKFGAAYGVRTGIHVGVDMLVNQLEASGGAISF